MGVVIATLIVIVVIAAVIAAFIAQDYALLSLAHWQEGGVGTSRSEVVRNLVLGAVAVVALVVGSLRVWTAHRQAKAAQEQAGAAIEQARISEQGHITDRYAKAVEMLSGDNVRSRTGAVYALARIAQDSVERDHVPVMSVLSEFVCNPPYKEDARDRAEARRTAKSLSDIPRAIKCPDVVAALRSIAQRSAAQKAHESSVGFDVEFHFANLQELDLERVKLAGASLIMADLTGASLKFAKLSGADLSLTRLTDATFSFADLNGAKLKYVRASHRAEFFQANLTGADLTGADLTSADLESADLGSADLSDADLSNADLSDAELTGVKNLTQEQLDSTVHHSQRPPKLPPGLMPPVPPPPPEGENDEPPPES